MDTLSPIWVLSVSISIFLEVSRWRFKSGGPRGWAWCKMGRSICFRSCLEPASTLKNGDKRLWILWADCRYAARTRLCPNQSSKSPCLHDDCGAVLWTKQWGEGQVGLNMTQIKLWINWFCLLCQTFVPTEELPCWHEYALKEQKLSVFQESCNGLYRQLMTWLTSRRISAHFQRTL